MMRGNDAAGLYGGRVLGKVGTISPLFLCRGGFFMETRYLCSP